MKIFLSSALVCLVGVLAAGCSSQVASKAQTKTNRPTVGTEQILTESDLHRVNGHLLRPWPQASSVRLFVEADDRSDSASRNPSSRLLNLAERTAVESHLSVDVYTGGTPIAAACFVPHHFLRYYDATGKMVGEISICFCCSGVETAPDLLAKLPRNATYQSINFDGLQALFEKMGVPTKVLCDDIG